MRKLSKNIKKHIKQNKMEKSVDHYLEQINN